MGPAAAAARVEINRLQTHMCIHITRREGGYGPDDTNKQSLSPETIPLE